MKVSTLARRPWVRRVAVAVAVLAPATAAGAVTQGALGRARLSASQVGSWAPAVTLPSNVVGVHAAVLRTGKVLLLTGFNGNPAGYVFDPATNTGKIDNPPDNVFCAGQTFLTDGTVIFAGGLLAPAPAAAAGIPAIDTFDPITETWTKRPDMANGRWYPTTTRMTDGTVLITAGRSQVATTKNYQVELYTPGPPASVALHGADEILQPYPHQYMLPNGKMVATDSSRTVLFDPSTVNWSSLANHISLNGRPAGVLLPGGPSGSTKIMLFGGLGGNGTSPAVANTEVFDTANPGAGWVSKAPIPQPRNDMNTVQLPDGTILAVGGNGTGDYGTPQLSTLLYDPSANTWTTLASQAFQRAYHSTAVLLPDGRVLSSGDTSGQPGNHTLEIYSPPYLFKGARPSITSAPSSVSYNQQFNIATSGTVSRAVLMSPGATTHNDDMNQRHIELAITQNGGGVTATAPANANLGAPGWYMLFVLDSNGIPSTATWVKLGGTSNATKPGPPTNAQATAGDGQANVTWSAPSNDGGASIDHYTVTSNPGGLTATTANGSTLNANVTGLTNGTSYTFTVTAHNSVGDSVASAPSNAVIPHALTVPDPPTNASASAGIGRATVSWNAPLNNGGASIDHYTVTTAPPDVGPFQTADGNTLNTTITGLTPGTSYTFTITAHNSVGNSSPSAASNAVIPLAPTVPDPPTNLNATAGNAQATLTWSAPVNNGGATIDHYTVTTSPPDIGPFQTADGITLNTIVNGLTNGTSYTFTITAHNSAGDSSASAPSNAVVPSASTVPGQPLNVTAKPAAGHMGVVTWSAPSSDGGSQITSYIVTSSPGGLTATWTSGPLTATVTGLTAHVTYTFTVVAGNINGPGPPSAPSNPITPR